MKKTLFFMSTLFIVAALLGGPPALASKSDFQTFPPGPHYVGVVLQQGAVQLDEDWNETVELEIFARDLGLADEVYGKEITDDPCKWIFLGYLHNSGDWEENIFTLPRDLYPAVQSGLRILVEINADALHPTYLEHSKLSAVPVPGTLLLMGTGLFVLARRYVKPRYKLNMDDPSSSVFQRMVLPPSTKRVCPVMKSEASEAKKITGPMMSLASPTLLRRVKSIIFS